MQHHFQAPHTTHRSVEAVFDQGPVYTWYTELSMVLKRFEATTSTAVAFLEWEAHPTHSLCVKSTSISRLTPGNPIETRDCWQMKVGLCFFSISNMWVSWYPTLLLKGFIGQVDLLKKKVMQVSRSVLNWKGNRHLGTVRAFFVKVWEGFRSFAHLRERIECSWPYDKLYLFCRTHLKAICIRNNMVLKTKVNYCHTQYAMDSSCFGSCSIQVMAHLMAHLKCILLRCNL